MPRKLPKSTVQNIIEVSCEMGNPKGGVFRVLESKAHEMVRRYGDNYLGIGPYNLEKSAHLLLEKSPPPWLKTIFSKLAKWGIQCHFGHWNLFEKPQLILLKANGFSRYPKMHKQLEKYFDISLDIKHPFHNDLLKWAGAAGLLLAELLQTKQYQDKTVVHFHTWESITALMYLKWKRFNTPTVYTTHV